MVRSGARHLVILGRTRDGRELDCGRVSGGWIEPSQAPIVAVLPSGGFHGPAQVIVREGACARPGRSWQQSWRRACRDSRLRQRWALRREQTLLLGGRMRLRRAAAELARRPSGQPRSAPTRLARRRVATSNREAVGRASRARGLDCLSGTR